jgi:hypothetical protein
VESTGLPKPEMLIPSSGESHLLAANVYQQDELRGVNKVELSPVNSSRESHGHQELSRVNKVQRERGISHENVP